MNWTREADDYLKAHRGSLSSSQIGKHLGCSRNAVVGRAHRLKLDPLPRGGDWRIVNTPRRVKAKKPKAVKPEKVLPPPRINDAQIPLDQRKTLIELEEHHCRWPVGDPREPGFFFCGAAKMEDSAYCAGHHAVAHNIEPAEPFVPFTFRRAA